MLDFSEFVELLLALDWGLESWGLNTNKCFFFIITDFLRRKKNICWSVHKLPLIYLKNITKLFIKRKQKKMKCWSNFPNNFWFFRLCLKVDLMGDDQVLFFFWSGKRLFDILFFFWGGGGVAPTCASIYVSVTQSYQLQTVSKPKFHGRMLCNSMYGLLSDWFWSRLNDKGLSLLKMFQVHMNLWDCLNRFG